MEAQKVQIQSKEYQTLGIFAILAVLTFMVVLLFKVVLFAPKEIENYRQPAYESGASKSSGNKLSETKQ